MDEETLVSVVRGQPTPEETAALVIALASRSVPPVPPSRTSAWARSARPAARPASWRASGLPR
ncbi:acyl-CoA carboxylase subunit epsilon [Actinoplanes sp. N902-109]|uniref:acyl-CoA carboxylase subunit epsilon n=1 Tax=Actinoplanes sp. (strain N902-109) TaxID=649831 RepID=UPI0003294954|nr:acyl-CoA carboxylase subunit epsilon [Actinoplanes sp. N902-109]AGL20991.1 hypothetical protein L083_7481 [Actinoplanes sp. N902-109]